MVGRCKVRPSERINDGVSIHLGQVIFGGFVGRRLDDLVRIVIADKEALKLCRLSITDAPHQDNAAGRFTDDANAAPDGRLSNEIRDIALRAHESLQLVTRYA